MDSIAEAGVTKGKSSTSKRITKSTGGLSDSDTVANELAPPSPSSSSKVGNSLESELSEPQNTVDEKDTEQDDDTNSIRQQGTIPKAVSKTNSPFNGPEFAEIYQKLKAEGNVGEMIICCTSCSTQINHKMTGSVFVHPLLHVLLCRKCKNFYNSGGFTQDENGIDEYCRWCAEGGELLCCDTCPHAFCKACIRRNFGRSELTKISKLEEWQCLICDASPLLELQATCQLVLKYNKKESKRKSGKGSSHSRPLFSSPSMDKVTRKAAIEICLENTGQAGRFLREGVALLRKKLVSATDPENYAIRVGSKLKQFLDVTKENLDVVVRAVDRELAKVSPADPPTVPPVSEKLTTELPNVATEVQNLVKADQTKSLKIKPSEITAIKSEPLDPENTTSSENETTEMACTESPKLDLKQSEDPLNGKALLPKETRKRSNHKKNSVNEDKFTSNESFSFDDSTLLEDGMKSDTTEANHTEEHIEKSESVENITPNDNLKDGSMQEDIDTLHNESQSVLADEATLLDADSTLLASQVSPLKNNVNGNQMVCSKKYKMIDKTDEADCPSNRLKIVLKKLPATNDLDKEIVKKDKSKTNKSKRSHTKVKGDRPSKKSQRKHAKSPEESAKEDSTLETGIAEDEDNELESKTDVEQVDTHSIRNSDEESNSDAETLVADSYVAPLTCDSPKSNDDEPLVAQNKTHIGGGDELSDAETINGSFNSDHKNKPLHKSALENVAEASASDSGNDAAIDNDPCDDSGNETETDAAGSANNLLVNAFENSEDVKDSTSGLQAVDANAQVDITSSASLPRLEDEENMASDHDAESSSLPNVKKLTHNDSLKTVNLKKKRDSTLSSKPLKDSLDNFDILTASVNGFPGDKNKIAKKDLLNQLFEESDQEEAGLDKGIKKKQGEVEKRKNRTSKDALELPSTKDNGTDSSESLKKKHAVLESRRNRSSKDTADSNPTNHKEASLKDAIDISDEGEKACSEDGSLTEGALAKKKLLSCLLNDSDDDNTNMQPASSRKSPSKSETPIKSFPNKKRIPKPKSARSLDEITSGSSLSSDEEVALPKTKAARKIIPISDVKKFINEDSKLKSKVAVVLQPLKPGIMKQLATCSVVQVKCRKKPYLSEKEALDRDINRLCNLKSLKSKNKRKNLESDSDHSDSNSSKSLCKTGDKEIVKTKEEKPVKTVKENKSFPVEKKSKKGDISSLFKSSSEDEVSDHSDADDAKNKNNKLNDAVDIETKSMNKRAKDMLSKLLTMSSDEQSDADVEDGDDKKKSKNEKKEKDEKKSKQDDSDQGSMVDNSDDDSDDFTPVKKNKRFNSKLLRAKLSDSDESYKASSDSRNSKKRKKRNAANSKGSDTSESSEDSSDAVVSVKKRKRRTRESAKSSGTSDEDSGAAKKKKRRRIKTMTDSSDSDVKAVDEKNTTPSGKGRKNIRRVIRDTKLRDDTKNAAREEEERRSRVAELQKKYNVVIVDAGKDGAPITQKLVLEKDSKTGEALVEVHPDLISKLKPHQVDGVKFLWESVCESIDRLQTHHGSGCILAHCMGLGKTLQVVTFLHTLLANEDTCIKTGLVVCPLNTVVNWFMEFRNWLDEIDPPLEVIELSSVKSNYERARAMKHWTNKGGILIIGYEMFRNLVQEKGKRIPKSCRETFQTSLINPGPDVVVCDEGHLLKNSATSLSKAMSRIGTRRRVVLTGTPLQNNLAEYHCMVDFVKPSLLGTMKEFKNRFVNPIQNGQCADSTAQDVRIMKRRAHILHNLLDGCVQRRDYNVLTPFLPQKHEYVISVKLTDIQVKLYVYYLENLARKSARSSSLFSDYQQLMRIWTHPRVIRLAEIRQENKPTYDDSENSFIDDGSTGSESDSNVICLDNDEEPSTSKGKKKGDGTSDEEVVNNWKSRSRGGRQNANADGDVDKFEAIGAQSNNWWTEFVSEEDAKKFEHSGKLILLFSILKECYNIGDKLLLFSQSLLSLDLIETMLQECKEFNEDGTENPHYAGRWVNGTDYFRLDGSTSADTRSRYTRIFNDPENFTARLFLISTRAGSLGINLVAANRVIVFDASWNPSHDVQSIFRVYRFGQEKPVYVYRFLAQGTMEEKIYDRQVTKQSLACRVVDEQQIERHFNFSDLQELYAFTPERVNKRPTPMLPKDRLLAELLMKKKDLIVNYHEHDSLLVNQEAEELSEEERKAAWVEFEVERKGMMDSSGQLMSQGLYGVKLDVGSLISAIQIKEPGLSVNDLQAKLHETMAAIHQARREALEQQRQEILRVQLHNQQRELMAAQQKREIMQQVQQRIAHGDFTQEQAAWYSQVMGPGEQSQLNKIIQANAFAAMNAANANVNSKSKTIPSALESWKNVPNK